MALLLGCFPWLPAVQMLWRPTGEGDAHQNRGTQAVERYESWTGHQIFHDGQYAEYSATSSCFLFGNQALFLVFFIYHPTLNNSADQWYRASYLGFIHKTLSLSSGKSLFEMKSTACEQAPGSKALQRYLLIKSWLNPFRRRLMNVKLCWWTVCVRYWNCSLYTYLQFSRWCWCGFISWPLLANLFIHSQTD